MTGSERPSLEKRSVPSRTAGRQFWKRSGAFKCLELQGLGDPSRTLEGNFRKSSESVSRVLPEFLSTSDFQSEVGEVCGEIGGELPAKFGRRFSSFFCWGKSSETFSTKTPPQILPSDFTTRFWVVAGPKFFRNFFRKVPALLGVWPILSLPI